MSFENFLYRKSEENAHNEILAFLTLILGVVILIGGLLVTIIVVEKPNWFLLFPYQPPSHPSTILGLILTLTGFVLLSAGFILVVHYDRKKSWYISQLEKSTLYKKGQAHPKSIRELLEEYKGKR